MGAAKILQVALGEELTRRVSEAPLNTDEFHQANPKQLFYVISHLQQFICSVSDRQAVGSIAWATDALADDPWSQSLVGDYAGDCRGRYLHRPSFSNGRRTAYHHSNRDDLRCDMVSVRESTPAINVQPVSYTHLTLPTTPYV